MAGEVSNAAGNAATIALKLSSATADAISFVATLGEELPCISPILKTLKAIREQVETVKSNREELKALEERCRYMTAYVVAKFKENPRSDMNVSPLEDCVKVVGGFVDRCSRRDRLSWVVKASSDKDDIAQLNARIDRLAGDFGLAINAILERKVDKLTTTIESMETEQRGIKDHLRLSPIKLAKVPRGAPVRKSWHVERHRVMGAVLKTFTRASGQRLVGLVGDSGSGKTTAASAIVRRDEVRETFSDGIIWLSVNEGAKQRLPALMLELAQMMYDDIDGGVGRRPEASEDGTAYVKQRVVAGRGSKCLVVADNVWEQEVVSKLLETGMWVLLSTRQEALVTDAKGEAVGVAELSEADAESLLRIAAELPSETRLPDAAIDLIDLCGRVAMDLAFVGRWSNVRGRRDRTAWSDAAEKVRAAMEKVGADPGRDKRRKAVLQAGFEDLAIGSEDKRVPRLYLSLAVMPEGRAFSLKEAAVLLYDRKPSPDDEASVRGVLDILERWTIIRPAEDTYRMHDAHSNFARENLMDRGDVRRPVLQRWVTYISSLDALRSLDQYTLKGLWFAVERVGGDRWEHTRPYEKALAKMDKSDPLLQKSIKDLGRFQNVQEDWEGASTTYGRLLEIETTRLGTASVEATGWVEA
eukprot:g13678.t1